MKIFYDIKKLENELNPIYIGLMEKVMQSCNADKHYSGKVEITDILKPFTHITLDEKYKIIAYSSYEIHGPFGSAVAVNSDKEAPDVYLKMEHCLFQRIIPDVCYPVNEVIFCDGTPEGFYEVILLNDVIWKLFKGYAEVCLDNYIFSLEDLSKKELLFKPVEVSPKYYKNYNGTSKLLLLEKSNDGGIDLCEYSFSNRTPKFWQRDKDYSHIEFENGRFSNNKCCCCFSSKRICVCEGEEQDFFGEEKEYEIVN